MSNVSVEFTIEGDSEGYVVFECPYCGSEFKLNAGEYQNEEKPVLDLFCPYCGLVEDKDSFLSSEVIEHIEVLAHNYLVNELNKSFGKIARNFKSSKTIKMEYRPLKLINVTELNTQNTNEEIFECITCKKHVKALYCLGTSKIFCPYCGVDL